MSTQHPPSRSSEVVSAAGPVLSEEGDTPKEKHATILSSPKESKRQYYRDPVSGVQREIWRPGMVVQLHMSALTWLMLQNIGDGDGDRSVDYFESPGPLAPLAKRWRFFQVGLLHT